jgi:glycosyltransferase involved in cell wall biosynthesis
MRILLIAPSMPDYCEAFASAVASMAETLLIVPEGFFSKRFPPNAPNLTVCQVDWPARHRSLRNPLFIFRLLIQIKKFSPDVIHVLEEKNVWLNLLLPFIRNIPVVTTVHDVEYHPGDTMSQKVPRWCPRLFVRQSNAVVVHGPVLRKKAIQVLSISDDDIHVIRHPATTNHRKLASSAGLSRLASRNITVLFFGRIQLYKGVDILIDAANRVASDLDGVRFVIAGRSDHLTRPILARATAPYFDVRDRFIADQEVAQLFTDADIVVLPYVEASQSGVLAIAYSFGLPVVATDVGELGSSVRQDDAGIVVKSADPTALAEALVRLISDPGLRRSCANNARLLANTTLGPDGIGSDAVAVYQKVIARFQSSASGRQGRLAFSEMAKLHDLRILHDK